MPAAGRAEAVLRPQADLYVSPSVQVPYLCALLSFLQRHGVRTETYIPSFAYQDGDVILLGPQDRAPAECACRCFVPGAHKAALWKFLQRVLPALRD